MSIRRSVGVTLVALVAHACSADLELSPIEYRSVQMGVVTLDLPTTYHASRMAFPCYERAREPRPLGTRFCVDAVPRAHARAAEMQEDTVAFRCLADCVTFWMRRADTLARAPRLTIIETARLSGGFAGAPFRPAWSLRVDVTSDSTVLLQGEGRLTPGGRYVLERIAQTIKLSPRPDP